MVCQLNLFLEIKTYFIFIQLGFLRFLKVIYLKGTSMLLSFMIHILSYTISLIEHFRVNRVKYI